MTPIFYKKTVFVTDAVDSIMVTTIEYREDAKQYRSILHPANPEDMYTMQECKCGKATVFRNIRQLANVAFTILLLLRKFISNFICYPSLDVRCN